MQVTGTSMQPTLKPGDIVVANTRKTPREGHVVIARSPQTGEWIIKRLTKIESDGYWLEGDAHEPGTAKTSTDSWVFGAVQRDAIAAVAIWPLKVSR